MSKRNRFQHFFLDGFKLRIIKVKRSGVWLSFSNLARRKLTETNFHEKNYINNIYMFIIDESHRSGNGNTQNRRKA